MATNAIASKADFEDGFDALYSILSIVLPALNEEECPRTLPLYEDCDNIYHYERMIRHYNILLELHEISSTPWKQAMQFVEGLQNTPYRDCAKRMHMQLDMYKNKESFPRQYLLNNITITLNKLTK